MENKMKTTQDLIDAVRLLASESPENQYLPGTNCEPCLYDAGVCSDGSIGCLMGQGLRKLGVTQDLSMRCSIIALIDTYKVVEAQEPSLEVETARREWLRSVQCHQDQSYRWAKCVMFADQIVMQHFEITL